MINQLLQYVNGDNDSKIERILWIDKNKTYCFVINIKDKNALPVRKEIEELEFLESKKIVFEIDGNEFFKHIDEEDLTKKEAEIIKKAWAIIKFINDNCSEPYIFDKHYRGKVIKETAIKYNSTDKTVRTYLRRYWQGGKNKDALIPRYSNCGTSPNRKIINKLGRTRIDVNKKKMAEINIDERMKKIIINSMTKWYGNSKEIKPSEVYFLMLNNYYTDANGKLLFNRPNYDQFKYHFYKFKSENNKKYAKLRFGDAKYESNYRPLRSDSTSLTIGPGSLYLIDATKDNTYLVNRYNRTKSVGKPTVYLVVDVFSRMIAGVYVGLEEISWVGAMMALENSAEDKVPYCESYGIPINKYVWPCQGAPSALLADRGEIEGHNIESVIDSFGIQVKNAGPYRGDMKGLIEQFFNMLQNEIEFQLKGVTKKNYERGDKDPRRDACLDIHQYTQIIIMTILKFNNHWANGEYKRSQEMIKDGITTHPIDIWNWGIENCSGRLMKPPSDLFKLLLMPTKNVVISRHGIILKKKIQYITEDSEVNKLIINLGLKNQSIRKQIRLDPRDVTNVYLLINRDSKFVKCTLSEASERYRGMSWKEVSDLLKDEENMIGSLKEEELQAKVDLMRVIDNIQKEADNQVGDLTYKEKSDKLKGITDTRNNEKKRLRQEEVFNLDDPNSKIVENETVEDDLSLNDYYSNEQIIKDINKFMDGDSNE